MSSHHPISRFIFGPASVKKGKVTDADYYGQVADDDIEGIFGDLTVVRALTPKEIVILSDFDTGAQVISDDCFDPSKAVKWELVTCTGTPEEGNVPGTTWILVSF